MPKKDSGEGVPDTWISRRFQAKESITVVGGRPGLNVDFKAVCDAVLGAWNGSGETITEIAERFGVSRGWIYKWVYPALDGTGSSGPVD